MLRLTSLSSLVIATALSLAAAPALAQVPANEDPFSADDDPAPEAPAPEDEVPEWADAPADDAPATDTPAPETDAEADAESDGDAESGLLIHFVSTNQTYSTTAYEVFSAESREVVASGIGAKEAQGETPQVWNLAPGLYKIVKAGEPFETPTDFVVAHVTDGAVTEIVVIVDAGTGGFRGGGPLVGDLPEGLSIAGIRLALNGGGNLMFSQEYNAVGNTSGVNVLLGLFGHFGLVYDRGDHFLDVSADLQLNLTERPWASPFSTLDRFEGNATYTYKINNPYVGPYARAGFRTRVFPGYLYAQSDTGTVGVMINRTDGTSETQSLGGEANADDLRIELSEPFAPFILQEEIGANLKAVDVDLRLLQLVVGTRIGFGFRQGLVNDLLVVDGDEEGPTIVLNEVDDYSTLGPVAGATAKVTLARWLFGAANFGMMIPVQNTDDAGDNFGDRLLLSLSGTGGLKIPALTSFLFASFDYTFRLERDGFITSDTQFDHTLMARVNVTLF